MQDFTPWKTCDTPVPIEEQACNIPHVCKLKSRELRKERYLFTLFISLLVFYLFCFIS